MIETRRLKKFYPNNFKFCAFKKNYKYKICYIFGMKMFVENRKNRRRK